MQSEHDRILACSCVAVLPCEQFQPIFDDDTVPVSRIWGNRQKFWPHGSILKVRFLNGDRKQQAMAWERFRQLDELCGIAFKLVTFGESDIRVAFNRNSGHWSYVGTDCDTIPQQFQTMNIGLSSRDSGPEWDRVVLHEAMHALGFNHEHQHPRNKIPWNVRAVYNFYGRTQGWSRAEIDAQVLRRGSFTGFAGTDPDLESLMQYPVDRALVTDPKFAVGWNKKLSRLDLEFLKQVYP